MAGSVLDVLNEEMQLTYETANLQLLLEGALSDRFVKNQRIIKPRTTIGFPISLKPQSRYKNALAVVEVEVETAARNLSDKDQPDPPSITALLPREKTYNVAAIKDRMTSIGAGAVINAISVGGSWISGHKTFYVVQDQDTVAIERPADPNRPNTTSFAWEFRPVLGEEFVRGGLKQTFVQLALPILDPKDCYGSIHIRTYWRRFDRKNGIDKEPIEGSVLSRTKLSIPHFDLTPRVEDVRYQDLGDATVLVTVQGSFLAGTYVQLGATRFDAAKGLLVEESGLKFVAPAAALAMWTAKVVSRDGNSTDLLNPLAQEPLPKLNQLACGEDNTKKTTLASPTATVAMQNVQISPNRDKVRVGMQKMVQVAANSAGVSLVDNRTQARVELVSSSAAGFDSDQPILTVGMDSTPPCRFGSIHIKQLTLTPLNESESELLVAFDPIKDPMTTFPDDILLDVGHKVFGLADTAVKRDLTPTAPTVTAIVPTALLVSGRKVRVFRMFWTAPNNGQSADPQSNCFDTAKDLSDFDLDSAVERLVLVSVDADGKATYLLYGNGLDHAKILVPAGLNVVPFDNVGQGRIARIDITKEILKQTKKIVLQKTDKERPLVLDVPQPDAAATGPKVTLDSPVIQNTDEMEVSVEKVEDLVSVKMGDKSLRYAKGKDTIRLKFLKADGVTSEQKTQELVFEFKDKTKVKVKLEVVAARVGIK